MANERYVNRRRFKNVSPMYRKLFENRDLDGISQYTTALLAYPSPSEMASLTVITHIWKIGDHFWKLAHLHYGRSNLWWIIAWYNKTPTEAHLRIGYTIFIPTPVSRVLGALDL